MLINQKVRISPNRILVPDLRYAELESGGVSPSAGALAHGDAACLCAARGASHSLSATAHVLYDAGYVRWRLTQRRYTRASSVPSRARGTWRDSRSIKIHFKDSNGNLIKTVEANEGDDILSIAHEYDIDLEGTSNAHPGACEGSIACSTCHVILDEDTFFQLEEPGDDENDMLDLAFGLTDTSRLGCQVKVSRDFDGISVQLPSATRNMYVDGAKPGH